MTKQKKNSKSFQPQKLNQAAKNSLEALKNSHEKLHTHKKN